jgi:hypothetical protein
LIYAADFYQLWPVRALEYTKGNRIGRAAFDVSQSTAGMFVERLSAQPQTLIHGEFVGSNVLVRGHDRQPRDLPDRLGDGGNRTVLAGLGSPDHRSPLTVVASCRN